MRACEHRAVAKGAAQATEAARRTLLHDRCDTTCIGNGREYELLYNGQGRDGESFLLGLTDPAKLK